MHCVGLGFGDGFGDDCNLVEQVLCGSYIELFTSTLIMQNLALACLVAVH